MQIELRLDAACQEPKIIIQAREMTPEVSAALRALSQDAPPLLAGFQGDTVTLLTQADIVRVYAAGGKVYAATGKGEYQLRMRLYELETRLDARAFARISNAEIVNLHQVRGFDLSFAGTICVSLSDGAVTYVSRRYVAKIKRMLGI